MSLRVFENQDAALLRCRLYDTREKELIESFVDDVMELVELRPIGDALVRAGKRVCVRVLFLQQSRRFMQRGSPVLSLALCQCFGFSCSAALLLAHECALRQLAKPRHLCTQRCV